MVATGRLVAAVAHKLVGQDSHLGVSSGLVRSALNQTRRIARNVEEVIMNPEGLIPILGGALLWLVATGVLPKNPKKPEQLQEWRQKYGKVVKILAPIVFVFGIVQLSGII